MQEIKNYLDNPDKTIEQGIELFAKYCPAKKDVIHRLLVKKDLDLICSKLKSIPIENHEATILPKRKQKESKAINDEEVLEKVAEIDKKLQEIYIQRAKLSNQLADLPDEALKEKVDEILALREEYSHFFLQKQQLLKEPVGDTFEETEVEKSILQKKEPNAAIAILLQKIQPLRVQASKLKDKIAEKPSHPKNIIWQEQQAKNKAELDSLEAQLAKLRIADAS